MKTALVIMAAGIGSRYGGGIKQLAAVGPNGEILMDYSIHDAIAAGFDKIVFIIRRDIEQAFREVIGDRIEKVCAGLGVEVAYAYQALDDLPANASLPAGRTKPWGHRPGSAGLPRHPARTLCRHQRRRLLRQAGVCGAARLFGAVRPRPPRKAVHGRLCAEKHPE